MPAAGDKWGPSSLRAFVVVASQPSNNVYCGPVAADAEPIAVNALVTL